MRHLDTSLALCCVMTGVESWHGKVAIYGILSVLKVINFTFLLTNTYSREKVMQALGFHSNDSFRHHVLIVVLKWWNQKIVSQCHFQPYWGIHLQKSLFFHTRMKIFIIVGQFFSYNSYTKLKIMFRIYQFHLE